MKALFAGVLLFAGLFTTLDLNSSKTHYPQNENRLITVTGSADVTVQPDEIELEIVLKEYNDLFSANLNSIEKKFYQTLEKHKITKDKIALSNSDYYWYSWWHYRKHSYKQKVFRVTLDIQTDFLALVKDLDTKGIYSLKISKTTNSKLQELRKDIKIQAVKAAKEKAHYLLESIDEKIGRVVSIQEMPDNQNHYYYRQQNLVTNVSIGNSGANENTIDQVQAIKLRYEVKTVFEIAD